MIAEKYFLCTNKTMIQALLREYPHLDHLMVQSIVSAYENGTLDKILEQSETIEKATLEPSDHILKNAITVDDKNILSDKEK